MRKPKDKLTDEEQKLMDELASGHSARLFCGNAEKMFQSEPRASGHNRADSAECDAQRNGHSFDTIDNCADRKLRETADQVLQENRRVQTVVAGRSCGLTQG